MSKYYNAKITNPIHRGTAYDFNVQLDFNQLRTQTQSKSGEPKFAPAASGEALDVKEHELVFQMANSKNAFANRRLHVQSSLNNMSFTPEEARRICTYANITPEQLAEALRNFSSVNNKALEEALEDTILSKLRYVGVAITPQANTRAHEKQSSQGFAATRGGLNTIINTGEGAIYPGDTVEIGVNFDRLRYGSAPRFHQPSMRDSGVPYDKAVLAVRSAKGQEQFTNASLQMRVLKDMLAKRTQRLSGHEIGGKSVVAIVNTASSYHPDDPDDIMLPAEVTTVLPVRSLPEQGKSVDSSLLTVRTQDRLDAYLLPAELLTPAGSARDPRSGHDLQALFADEYLHRGGEFQKHSLANTNISGSNVVNAPINRDTVRQYRIQEYALPGAMADRRDRIASHIGQHMDERIVLKVRGRKKHELHANLRSMIDALNREWDRMGAEAHRDENGHIVDPRGDHVLYARFLQYYNREADGRFSVAGYQDAREIHRRNMMGVLPDQGHPVSTGYYYGGITDRQHAPFTIGATDEDRGDHVENLWRGDARAYYEEFLNRARVPTVFVVWEDHVDIPMHVNQTGQGVIEDERTMVPGVWRLVQTSFFTHEDVAGLDGLPSDFRLEPVQSDQLFGYTPSMARSFMYGNAGQIGVVGIGRGGEHNGAAGPVANLEDVFRPYNPGTPPPNVALGDPTDVARLQFVGSLRQLYEMGNGAVGMANSLFQTPPVFNLGSDVGNLALERFVLVPAGHYAETPGYAQNDGLTFLLAAMSSSSTDNALAHSPIAHLVRETIQCTLECMRGEVVKHNQRVIGIALSGAPPGQPFDVCLSSIT